MDAASFLSAVIEIAIGVAGFAGIVAAVRQRQLDHWPTEQLLLLQVLFTATAAAIVFALLPQFLAEYGLAEPLIWQVSSAALICWAVGALSFRIYQGRKYGVAMPIPVHVRAWAVLTVVLQIHNLLSEGQAWPFLLGIMTMLMNAFSVFLLLILSPVEADEAAADIVESDT